MVNLLRASYTAGMNQDSKSETIESFDELDLSPVMRRALRRAGDGGGVGRRAEQEGHGQGVQEGR